MIKRLMAILALALSFALSFSAQANAGDYHGQHYSLQVISESHAGNAPVRIAYVITPDKGWHIYWVNPGETGYKPVVEWQLPKGWRAAEIRHPAPKRLTLGGYSSNVHEGRTILLQDLVGGTGAIKAKGTLDLLVCSETNCVPDPMDIAIDIPADGSALSPDVKAVFDEAAAAMPARGADGVHFQLAGKKLSFTFPNITLAPGDKAHLFGVTEGAIDEAAEQQFAPSEEGLVATVQNGSAPPAANRAIVLRIDSAGGKTKALAFDASEDGAAKAEEGGALALLGVIFTAFLGGLLLNLMPCVFPILSLKAMALARSSEGDEREAKWEAIGYSIGAIGVVMALGASILILRAAGTSIGWAFQLQDARVIAVLLLLVVAIAVNMAGLFELPSLNVGMKQSSGFMSAISTGALAAFVATPCTGPFMAGALGAALVMPTPAALMIFFGLGLGLAAPFLLIGLSKRARGWLPRPGTWMNTLRRILSLPMFATALGLAWILGRQMGVSGMTIGLAAALIMGLGLWWCGLCQHNGKGAGLSILPVIIAVALAISLPLFGSPGSEGVQAKAEGHTIPFSSSKLAALRAEGKPVFLYLTADWCLTCKVNEKTSLTNSDVLKAFDKAGVTIMRGDWTNGDAAITAFLKDNGKAGVPVYFWFPKQGAMQEMPQILTPSMLIDLAAHKAG